MMSKAIRIHEHGGPEVLKYEDVDPGRPGRGEVLIEHTRPTPGVKYVGNGRPPGGRPNNPGLSPKS